MHDVTIEPKWDRIKYQHGPIEYYSAHKDTLFEIYQHRLDRKLFDKVFLSISYGGVNEFPAKKMRFFHAFTHAFTFILPIFLLWMTLLSFHKKSKNSTYTNQRAIEASITESNIPERLKVGTLVD